MTMLKLQDITKKEEEWNSIPYSVVTKIDVIKTFILTTVIYRFTAVY